MSTGLNNSTNVEGLHVSPSLANAMLSAVSRPVVKMKVQWHGYDCIIQKLRYRDKVAKLKPDYSGNPMPYDYFWVDFNEIGF
jgi:hypothetical protein